MIIFLCLWEMIPGSYSGVKIKNVSRFMRTIFRCYFCSEKCVLRQLRLLIKTSNKSWYWTKESTFSRPKSEHVFANFKLFASFYKEKYALIFDTSTEPFQRGLSSCLVWIFMIFDLWRVLGSYFGNPHITTFCYMLSICREAYAL